MKVIKNMFYGVSISSIVYLLMGVVFTNGAQQKTIISILIMGLTMGILSSIYKIEKISFLLKVWLQFFGSLFVFLLCTYMNQWVPLKRVVIVPLIFFFCLIFFIVWIIFYFKEKKEIASINHSIKKMKKENL